MKKLNFAIFLLLVYFGIPCAFEYIAGFLGMRAGYFDNFSRNGILSFALISLFVYFNMNLLKKIKSKENHLINMLFGFCSFLFFALNFYLTYYPEPSIYLNYATFILIINLIIYIFASVLLFVSLVGFDFTRKLFSRFKNLIISLFVFMLLFMQLGLIFEKFWKNFSYIVSASVSFLLSLFYKKAGFVVSKTGVPSIFVENFGTTIGASCSGIESLLLFIFLFTTIFFFDIEKTKKFFKKEKIKFIFLTLIGLVGIFLTNILRVFILMVVGVYSPKLSFSLFHDNLGWIIFIIYFFLFYLFIWLPNLKKSKRFK